MSRASFRWVVLMAVVVMSLVTTPRPVAASGDCPLASGSGGTYLVGVEADLLTLRNNSGCLDESVIMTDDISLTTNPWTPINDFVGRFDGGGHEITGLSLPVTQSAGLFNVAASGAEFSDLTIRVATSSASTQVGALVGKSVGPLDIDGVHVIGDVSGTGSFVGGLVGSSEGHLTVTDSSVTGDVVGGGGNVGGVTGLIYNAGVTLTRVSVTGDVSASASNVGGLVGSMQRGDGLPGHDLTVTDSFVTGHVTSSATSYSMAGGVVGYVVGDQVSITSTHVNGSVTAQAAIVGGMIGWGQAPWSIARSSVTGVVSAGDDVTLTSFAGGLVGTTDMSLRGSIEEVFVGVAITATGNSVGGLVGYTESPITVSDTAVRSSVSGRDNVGGLFGYVFGSVQLDLTSSYALVSVSASGSNKGPIKGWLDPSVTLSASATFCVGGDCPVGFVVEDAELRSRVFLEGAGWDFVSVWCVDPAVNDGYPVLRAVDVSGGLSSSSCWVSPVGVDDSGRPERRYRPMRTYVLDPNGGVCRGNDVVWWVRQRGALMLPLPQECSRDGFVLEGWTRDPALTARENLLFTVVARSASLTAVWSVVEVPVVVPVLDDLSGTGPGVFVGWVDRRRLEGGAVVDGLYVPPGTVFTT